MAVIFPSLFLEKKDMDPGELRRLLIEQMK